MNRYARIIRFYASDHGGDTHHFGVGIPDDEMPGGWKIYFDGRVFPVIAGKGDVLPLPTARDAFNQFSQTIEKARAQLRMDLDMLEQLDERCAILETVSVVWPQETR